MLETMAAMQDAHNTQVHPHWRTSGYEYYRAVWVECAELLDHFGWKWWKRQRPDLGQVKLELVVILHFCMSDLSRADALNPDAAEVLGDRLFTVPSTDVLDTALDCGLSAYDAEFVVLARQFDVPLVTADREILRSATDVAVSLVDRP